MLIFYDSLLMDIEIKIKNMIKIRIGIGIMIDIMNGIGIMIGTGYYRLLLLLMNLL